MLHVVDKLVEKAPKQSCDEDHQDGEWSADHRHDGQDQQRRDTGQDQAVMEGPNR
jgi:hypothetical protein